MGADAASIKGAEMILRDLGELEGDLLVFGGSYSNLQALRAVQSAAERRGIPAERVICTGDVVAYCADPMGCVRLMRDWGVPVVAGNCEKQLAAGLSDCGCGFEDGSACDLLSNGWFGFADRACDSAARHWMGACPDVLVFRHAGQRCAVLHGGVTAVARFLWAVSPDGAFEEQLAALRQVCGPVDRVFAGHCGIAFHRSVGGVDWINAGVIGMPQNDGTRETRFAIVGSDGAVRIERLAYDAAGAAAAMRNAGLVQGYDAALLSGFWPSEEVLPNALRRSGAMAGSGGR